MQARDEQILTLVRGGASHVSVARMFGLSRQRVDHIVLQHARTGRVGNAGLTCICGVEYQPPAKHGRPAVTHFWPFVERTETCWLWNGPRRGDGYGQTNVDEAASRAAHRASYEMSVGPVPVGLQLRHACDNPPCVNPTHLIPGTAAENANDREMRGRGYKGRKRAS